MEHEGRQMTLQVYNSLTKKKETFVPREPNKVGMYVCGMTVYDYCHLGHARAHIAFDIIVRYLRSQGYEVNYIRNITDIDDKIIVRAAENSEPVDSLTERFIGAMNEDFAALGMLTPDAEPRATEHMESILKMIQVLIDKGFAYHAANGDVYYQVEKFAEYGKLSNRKLDEQQEGKRVEVDPDKRHPFDFVLWKAAKPDEISWQSPWGPGRPGWHIECSAMSTESLGNTFDIHGGGPDLKFPHHENEIAQSEAATGCHYVNYWMHAGALRINKEKMSKSLGNFFTIREILDQFPAEVVRYFLIASHYRSAIDYSVEALHEAGAALERFYLAIRGEQEKLPEQSVLDDPIVVDFRERFNAAMSDDFNTAGAISVLFEMVRELNQQRESDSAAVLAKGMIELGSVLGILQADANAFLQGDDTGQDLSKEAIEALIEDRSTARRNRDFAEADRIRDELKSHGVELNDSREGTTWQRI